MWPTTQLKPPAQLNSPILPHSSTVLTVAPPVCVANNSTKTSRTAQRSYPPAQLNGPDSAATTYMVAIKSTTKTITHTQRNANLPFTENSRITYVSFEK